MPDITMCANKECPLKDSCYRFTAIPNNYRQSYSWFPYVRDFCDKFIAKKATE